ncbi:hypothetical protein Trydic_g9385 [Trypoxylus dichotomus]
MAKYLGLDKLLRRSLLRRKQKTFLEQVYPSLTFSRIFGNVLFTFDDESVLMAILISSPFMIIYVICCTDYFNIMNMFKTITKYEQASDNMFFIVAIAGTFIRPIYFFLKRKEHKQIFLDVHHFNCTLGKEYQTYYMIDFILLRNVVAITVTNASFVIASNAFQLLDPIIINYFMFLMSYNANSANDLLHHFVGLEITKQFKTLNQNIVTIPLVEGTIKTTMEIVRYRMKLVRLATKFNELCTVPLLITLSLQCTLSIWALHSAFVMIVFKLPHYEFLVLLICLRMAFNVVHAMVIFGMMFGNVLFTFDDESVLMTILISSPFMIIYVICCTDYFNIMNMFKTVTKYEQASDNLFFIVAIIGTFVRPIHFFIKRRQHKQIFLDGHHFNCILGKEYQTYYTIDFILLRNTIGIIITSVSFIITSNVFQVLNPMIINYFMFLMSYNANGINDLLQYRVCFEISKQFKTLNQNIVTIPSPDGAIKTTMEIVRYRMKLVRLAARFNELCTVPLLVTLSLQCTLSIWVLHSAFVRIILKLLHYEFLALLICVRIAFNVLQAMITFGVWVSIQEEAQKTSTYIHDMWNKWSGRGKIDCHLKHLQLISLQLYNSRLSFTAYGFFELDWTLLHRARKTATYIHDIWNNLATKDSINARSKHLQLVALQLYNNRLSFTAYGFFALDWTLLQRVVAGTFFGCFVYATGNSAKDLDDSISEATDMFELYSSVVGQTTAILVICVNNKRFMTFFHRLNIVDKRIFLINVIGEKITSEFNRKFVIYGISLVIIEFLITFIPDYIFFIENETTIYLVTSYYPIITGGLFKVQLATLIYLLWKRFSALNRILKKLKWKMKDEVSGEKRNSTRLVKIENPYTELVATIHNIFNELCDLLGLINYLYGLQLLLAMGSAFAICARQFHSAYDTMRYPEVEYPGVDAYFSCQWAIVQVLEIFIVIIFAEKIHSEDFFRWQGRYSTYTLCFTLMQQKVDSKLRYETSAYTWLKKT